MISFGEDEGSSSLVHSFFPMLVSFLQFVAVQVGVDADEVEILMEGNFGGGELRILEDGESIGHIQGFFASPPVDLVSPIT